MSTDRTTELAGQVAVVTGSSSGIGRAMALELAAAGADVLVHAGHNTAGAKQTAAEVAGLGRTSQILTADFENEAEILNFGAAAWNWRGGNDRDRVDIWINNAGADILTGAGRTLDFEQKLRRLWQVDVLATVMLSRFIGEKMKQRGRGVIINIGWDQAESGMAGDTGEMFALSKGAVMAFTRSLAKTLAPQVRVNCLAPGWIKTAWGQQASEIWQQRARQESLLARWGTPEDVAKAARFLASPAATFITGQIVAVNGGRA
ncbi:MAG TPA: SDR family oxidoreductase [Pirellulales bacterium]|nr:SDR family oxidoreductase [Pirellulales bacterium]